MLTEYRYAAAARQRAPHVQDQLPTTVSVVIALKKDSWLQIILASVKRSTTRQL
jgi:hypothetical protein